MLLIVLQNVFVGAVGDQCPLPSTLNTLLAPRIATQRTFVAPSLGTWCARFVVISGGVELDGKVAVAVVLVKVCPG